MKRLVYLTLVFAFMLTAFTAVKSFATEFASKEEALKYIEQALKDPEIKSWVNNKYCDEKKFYKAVSLSSDKTIQDVARSFSDFQEKGGEITFNDEELKWIIIGLGALGCLLVIAIIF